MLPLLPLLAALSLAPVHVLAGVQELWWNVSYALANPDGLFERRVVGVNGSWPPPAIHVNNTDSLLIHVTNSLSEPTTLHHHGMFFNSSSWMDGAMGVSQCGIPPGESFDYHVPINSSGQWGTYWAHAHSKAGQYIDGLRTPLILNPPQEHYSVNSTGTNATSTYDDEFTVILGDWYHQQHDTLVAQFISVGNPGGAEPIPDSGLVYFTDKDGNFLTSTTTGSGVGFNENSTLSFTPGKTYRLRIINTGGFAMFHFWIDGHDMSIIEVDGTDIEEYPVDFLSITVAQRYSVLVTARNDTTNATNWAIHANMDTDMFDIVPPTLNPNITSSVTYVSGDSVTDLGPVGPDAYDVIDDTTFVPIVVIPQVEASQTIELEFLFDTMSDGTNHAMINGVTYNSPEVPAILSALTLGDNATIASAYGPQSFVVNHLDVIDIIIKNADSGKHPFHLHGHKMAIVHRTDDYIDDFGTIQEGQANPMRRDTTHVPAGGAVVLRVIADNPGVWFLHCHIEWHLEVGLAIQLIEAPDIAQQRAFGLEGTSSNFNVPFTNITTPFPAPPSTLNDECQALGMPFSGNAAGHASATDLSGLPLGPYPQNNGWHSKGIAAMAGCVLSAVLGMLTVGWYSFGGGDPEEVYEEKKKWWKGWRKTQ